ncbi:MAG: lytic transglycosylase domain-containing protein [Acidobacteria bacterium]|nr:lytic transglycosylase domain-containing protein [Acidobacteriota bacterium]
MSSLAGAAGARESLTPDLPRAVIERESAHFPCAVSPKGALGFMRLMPSAIRQFGIPDPLDPKENAGAETKLPRQLLVRHGGDPGLALAACNAGPGRVWMRRAVSRQSRRPWITPAAS